MKFSHACDLCTQNSCYSLIQEFGNQQSSFHPSVPKGDYHLSISILRDYHSERGLPPLAILGDYHSLERIIASHDPKGLSPLTTLRDYHSEEGLSSLAIREDHHSERGLAPPLPWGIITLREDYHLSLPWGIITQTEDYHPLLPWGIITQTEDYHPSLPQGIITQTEDYHPSLP